MDIMRSDSGAPLRIDNDQIALAGPWTRWPSGYLLVSCTIEDDIIIEALENEV